MAGLRMLLSELGIPESARWHEGRLWFCHWGRHEVVAVDLDGHIEVIAHVPKNADYSIDWLPDGRPLVTGQGLLRQEADGSLIQHADLSRFPGGWNELLVDGRGNIYINGGDFNFAGGGAFKPGIIVLITPDGTVRQVASDIAFPNGMAVTPDNSTLIVVESFADCLTAFDIEADGSLTNRRLWAQVGGDGIVLDAEGAVWCKAVAPEGSGSCVRIREGGEVLQKIELDRPCYACALGGSDGKTLFITAAEWWGVQRLGELLRADTGRVLMTEAPAPHAGWP